MCVCVCMLCVCMLCVCVCCVSVRVNIYHTGISCVHAKDIIL